MPATDVVALFGALDAETQDRAIAPAPPGRRKVVLATSIAETSLTIEGVRIVVDFGLRARAALRAGRRPDAAGNRARLARRRRSAPRPRRPHRARRLLSAVGRAADRLARALRAAGDPLADLVLPSCSISPHWGARDPERSASSIRRRRRALAEARALLADSARSTTTAASPRKAMRCAACRCRRGSPAWWSMRRAKARAALAADIAAVLTERGLGGDDVDLTHRSTSFRRDRSRACASDAARDGEALGRDRRGARRAGER